MTRTVLVTGSEGFLGRAVVAAILERPDVEVVRLARPGARPAPLPGTRTVLADLHEGWPATLEPVDALVHLAWQDLDDFRSPRHAAQVPFQTAFLTGALSAGVGRILAVGTCLEYGLVEGELHEGLEPRPTLPYAVAKAAVAEHLLDESRRHGVDAVWGRLFYPFGPGQAARSLWNAVHSAIRDGRPTVDMSPGDQQRDFIPVAEVGAIVGDLIDATVPGQEVVNICSGRPTMVKDLVAGWISDAGSSIRMNLGALPYPDYESFRFWGSRRRLDALRRSGAPASD